MGSIFPFLSVRLLSFAVVCLFGSLTLFFCVYIFIYMYSMYIGIQLRLSSLCLITIFELLSSIGKERRTFYSRVVEPPPIVPVI